MTTISAAKADLPVSRTDLTIKQKVILRVPAELVPAEHLRPVHKVGAEIDRYLPFMRCIYCGRAYPVFNGGNLPVRVQYGRLHCLPCYEQVDADYLASCPLDAEGWRYPTRTGRERHHRAAEINPLPNFPEELLRPVDFLHPPLVALRWDDHSHLYRAECIAPAEE